MNEPLTGDFIERDVAVRHDELMKQFARGACLMCLALHRIREEETYRTRGFKGFGDFLKSVGLSETNGRRYASCGPMLEIMYRDGDIDLIKHPDMLRPIAGMITAKQDRNKQLWIANRQVGIVRNAAQRAEREQVIFNEALIADAARRTGWLPPSEYKKKDDGPKTPEQLREQMRNDMELAASLVLHWKRTGTELVEELGTAHRWLGFDYLLVIMKEAEIASAGEGKE